MRGKGDLSRPRFVLVLIIELFVVALYKGKCCRCFPMPGIRTGIDADMSIASFTKIRNFKRASLLALSFTTLLPAFAALDQKDADNRAKALQHADNSTDSLKILLDVYDLSDKINRDKVKVQLLDVANRSDTNDVWGAVIKELASSTDDAGALQSLIQLSASMPEDEGKNTVQTVLQMEQANAEVQLANPNDIQQRVLEYTKSGMSFGSDPYKEIQNIYRALAYLGASSQGPMYLEYIIRLEDLVKKLPDKDHAIKNLFYTTAALYYTRKRDFKKAIESDHELLKQLDIMKAHEIAAGRDGSDLDYFYYVSYRRLLRNFKGLTPEEIEDIYQKCLDIVKTNERAREEFGKGALTNSYYYVATKRYKEAVPQLKKALEAPDISDFRRRELMGLLAWSLRESGNEKEELQVLREYTVLVNKDMLKRRADTYREIELRNAANKILAEELQEQEIQKEENRRMRITAVTLVYVLAVVLIFLCRGYFKLRHKVALLEKGNRRLRTNIEQIIDDGTPSGTRDLRKKNKLKG